MTDSPKYDGLPAVNSLLHVLNHFLLLSHELVVSYLHPVDLGLHGADFGLAYVRVHSLLHLTGNLDLLLPKHDLVSADCM